MIIKLIPSWPYSMVMLIAMLWGLGSNPGEDMDVCKNIMPLRHGGILNSCQATNVEERREASDHPHSVLPQNWGGIEP
ncbi:hypothetical protein TNCV_1102261 [Trichonephila clavipes]|nr:hypothetical protein TNCV_1102261 [Trichonephila clavipes]